MALTESGKHSGQIMIMVFRGKLLLICQSVHYITKKIEIYTSLLCKF